VEREEDDHASRIDDSAGRSHRRGTGFETGAARLEQGRAGVSCSLEWSTRVLHGDGHQGESSLQLSRYGGVWFAACGRWNGADHVEAELATGLLQDRGDEDACVSTESAVERGDHEEPCTGRQRAHRADVAGQRAAHDPRGGQGGQDPGVEIVRGDQAGNLEIDAGSEVFVGAGRGQVAKRRRRIDGGNERAAEAYRHEDGLPIGARRADDDAVGHEAKARGAVVVFDRGRLPECASVGFQRRQQAIDAGLHARCLGLGATLQDGRSIEGTEAAGACDADTDARVAEAPVCARLQRDGCLGVCSGRAGSIGDAAEGAERLADLGLGDELAEGKQAAVAYVEGERRAMHGVREASGGAGLDVARGRHGVWHL